MTPTRRATLDELRAILRTGRHPDGRTLGAALAARLGRTVGRSRPGKTEAAP